MNIKKHKKSVGVLFPHQKTKDRSPDMTGQIQLQRADLKQLIDQINESEDVAHGNVVLWYYQADPESEKGPYVSVELSPPYRPKNKSQVVGSRRNSFDDFFEEVDRDRNRED